MINEGMSLGNIVQLIPDSPHVLFTDAKLKEEKMKTNIHNIERIFRIILGTILISLAFFGPENLWFLAGILPLATGLYGWCPPYHLLGINTCTITAKKSGH